MKRLIVEELVDIYKLKAKYLYFVQNIPYEPKEYDYVEKIAVKKLEKNDSFHKCKIFDIECYVENYTINDIEGRDLGYLDIFNRYYFENKKDCEKYLQYRNLYSEATYFFRQLQCLTEIDKDFLNFLLKDMPYKPS